MLARLGAIHPYFWMSSNTIRGWTNEPVYPLHVSIRLEGEALLHTPGLGVIRVTQAYRRTLKLLGLEVRGVPVLRDKNPPGPYSAFHI